jgi:hypothetical protein
MRDREMFEDDNNDWLYRNRWRYKLFKLC